MDLRMSRFVLPLIWMAACGGSETSNPGSRDLPGVDSSIDAVGTHDVTPGDPGEDRGPGPEDLTGILDAPLPDRWEDLDAPRDLPSPSDLPEDLQPELPGDLPGDSPVGTDLAETGPVDLPPEDAVTPPDRADPDRPGPFPTTTRKADVRRGNRTIPVVAHVPDGLGPWPLVVFLPGFQASTDLYQGTVDRLASHGFLVVRAAPPGSLLNVSHVEMRDDARAVIDWALDGQGPLAGLADPARIGMMGHSLGGKISVMAAFSDPRIQAVFAMDPVNGGNPITGYTASLPDIVPDQVAPLQIPLGLPGEDWSATHTAPLSPACAPADQNFRTFYDAASSSPWKALWALGGADHQDFVDDPAACGFTCSVCPDGPGEDQDQIDAVRTLMVAFFRRHLAGETAMEDWLVGGRVPAEVSEVRHVP
ncbi:MAG TPA: hypothetical protein PLQ97_05120 [Myxococcota bacterium]|nr:hypothetical protein [Myxococcota bacterium]HQK51627.1 hypothetical protein [Myxococcota bacterium]